MAADFEGVLHEAMKLPEEARGLLAARLLESLDPGEPLSPEDWEAAWSPEIQRRIRDLESGAVRAVRPPYRDHDPDR